MPTRIFLQHFIDTGRNRPTLFLPAVFTFIVFALIYVYVPTKAEVYLPFVRSDAELAHRTASFVLPAWRRSRE